MTSSKTNKSEKDNDVPIYPATCPSFRSGTSFLDDFMGGFSKNIKITVNSNINDDVSIQSVLSQNSSAPFNEAISFVLKQKGNYAITIDSSNTKNNFGLKISNPDSNQDTSLDLKVSHCRVQNIVGFSYSFKQSCFDKKWNFTHSLNYSGNDNHEKRKRNISFKGDMKNNRYISGGISSSIDWSKKDELNSTFQSNICTSILHPQILCGLSCTSKQKIFYNNNNKNPLIRDNYSFESSFYFNYKTPNNTSAISILPQKKQLTFLFLQKHSKETQIGGKIQYNFPSSSSISNGESSSSSSFNLVLKHNLSKSESLGLRIKSDGEIATSLISKPKKNSSISLSLLYNVISSKLCFGINYKFSI